MDSHLPSPSAGEEAFQAATDALESYENLMALCRVLEDPDALVGFLLDRGADLALAVLGGFTPDQMKALRPETLARLLEHEKPEIRLGAITLLGKRKRLPSAPRGPLPAEPDTPSR